MTTNKEFLIEKRDAFIKFCEGVLKGKKADKLQQLRSLNIELFITAIVEQMIPYKETPSAYVLKMMAEEGMDSSLFKADELAKAARYISCFISVVS